MFQLKRALSSDFLRQLADSTVQGLARRDCFYDQFHYVNRHFVARHFEELAGLVVRAIAEVHPRVTVSDITYVNDFVAPVNLANAQIHTFDKTNKYGWHYDGIDRVFRPCYNLWIPLYHPSASTTLDDASLFDVLTPAASPRFYDADGKCSFPWSTQGFDPGDRECVSKLMGVPLDSLDDYVYFHDGGKTEKVAHDELAPSSVVRPAPGDCYVFNSSNLHASGPSTFARVGISIKFLVNNPDLGFHVLPHFCMPLGWHGMFVSWYEKYGTFSAYQEILDTYIAREQPMLERNADKLECVREFLLGVSDELSRMDS